MCITCTIDTRRYVYIMIPALEERGRDCRALPDKGDSVTVIDRVEIHEFGFEARNLARDGLAQNITFQRGSSIQVTKYAVVIRTKDGCRGEYVTHWVATQSTLGQMQMLAPRLIGKDARERIGIYEDLKRDIRQFDHMGHGAIDIALWDWAGKRLNASVCEMLGGYRKRLPAYASTYMGDRHGGLSSKEALCRLRPALLRSRLPRVQDPRLERRQPARRGRERAARGSGGRRPDDADARSGLRIAHLRRRALRRARLRRSRVLLVRRSVSRRRHLGVRAPALAREVEDAAADHRARARRRTEGRLRACRRHRHAACRPRVRHGHHRLA